MSDPDDPFRHHPGLRGKIKPPVESYFRDTHPDRLHARLTEAGAPTDDLYSVDEIEALRARFLARHPGGDLWVFAYGSLMWDPAFDFVEIRRARAPLHERRFILKDTKGARGTADAPGLMAALDEGQGCHGLAFRIAAKDVSRETRRIWFREQIAPAYHARLIQLDTDHGKIDALGFVANHAAASIEADLSFEEQVRYCATGQGFLGTSLEYVENLCGHFAELGIVDPELEKLAAAARAY
ncbi:gamma-glutamylcyclotransferase [Aestuariicoccus sp. MJ-SS9]|uniref:gamma-glutamylcyclotransferase n=1 Tax=Aestuariicoccus sp. MJ-SS9 TaxID=3079855 RepID=UPI002912632F|nr:gamma-glutamylcyclotransferase [Aestuariicoccus sp. MJ-SS9]MDU8912578.1 gamma-glutamylcyclotransferase [Aestuariicoccus sp. MJ-SS9]